MILSILCGTFRVAHPQDVSRSHAPTNIGCINVKGGLTIYRNLHYFFCFKLIKAILNSQSLFHLRQCYEMSQVSWSWLNFLQKHIYKYIYIYTCMYITSDMLYTHLMYRFYDDVLCWLATDLEWIWIGCLQEEFYFVQFVLYFWTALMWLNWWCVVFFNEYNFASLFLFQVRPSFTNVA